MCSPVGLDLKPVKADPEDTLKLGTILVTYLRLAGDKNIGIPSLKPICINLPVTSLSK